jgi:hypothetical protein
LNDPKWTAKLKAVPFKKRVYEDIIGYIPSGNTDTEENQAAVFNREIAPLGYPLWYLSRFTAQMSGSQVPIDQ